MKWNIKLFIFTAFVAILIIIAVLITFTFSIDTSKKSITAMEGKKIADDVAYKWNSSAVLIYVGKSSEMIKEGYFSAWDYRYWNGKNEINNCIAIKIYADGEVTSRLTKRQHDEYPIENWTVDSFSVISIAKANSQINEFLSKYSDSKIDSFFLTYSNSSKVPIWSISWHSSGFMDNPHNAHVVIDATSGDILDVTTQM